MNQTTLASTLVYLMSLESVKLKNCFKSISKFIHLPNARENECLSIFHVTNMLIKKGVF